MKRVSKGRLLSLALDLGGFGSVTDGQLFSQASAHDCAEARKGEELHALILPFPPLLHEPHWMLKVISIKQPSNLE